MGRRMQAILEIITEVIYNHFTLFLRPVEMGYEKIVQML